MATNQQVLDAVSEVRGMSERTLLILLGNEEKQGLLSRVSALETTVADTNKILRGNGKVGLIERVEKICSSQETHKEVDDVKDKTRINWMTIIEKILLPVTGSIITAIIISQVLK